MTASELLSLLQDDNKGLTMKTAQEARELLASYDFVPLVKLKSGESWCRRGRRIILQWQGQIPSAVPLDGVLYATITPDGALSMD